MHIWVYTYFISRGLHQPTALDCDNVVLTVEIMPTWIHIHIPLCNHFYEVKKNPFWLTVYFLKERGRKITILRLLLKKTICSLEEQILFFKRSLNIVIFLGEQILFFKRSLNIVIFLPLSIRKQTVSVLPEKPPRSRRQSLLGEN